jgi:hypothetical protein
MSGEMVKWRGGLPVPSPVDENRRAISEALALLKPSPARSNFAEVVHAAEVVDLPRVCAVHDRPYAARYVIGQEGRYRFAQTIRVTEALFALQYADSTLRAVLPCESLADETCPWCGASGFAAVLCGRCGAEVCYGKTTGRDFRCRASCGHKSTMSSEPRTLRGVVPGLARRGGWSAF